MASSPPRRHHHGGLPSAGDTPSTRTSAHTSRRTTSDHIFAEAQNPERESGEQREVVGQVAQTGFRMTRRLAAVLVVVALLVISLVTSLRVYVNQREQINQAQAGIAASNMHIGQLERDKQRWNDPDYVRAQARNQLGWVMPGETGYRVVDGNGQPYGGTGLDHTASTNEVEQMWWQRMWDSVSETDLSSGLSVQNNNALTPVIPSPLPVAHS